MITDSQTNFIYLADTLPKKYPDFYNRFKKTLETSNIDFALLPKTKDVWAVDYMPVQTDLNRFVRFTYHPSYLVNYKKYINTISDTDAICNEIRIDTIKTDIIIDGGNITKATNKVILTDRVFTENPKYERKELIKKLHELLHVDKIYFVPEQPGDFTGHSDGMVRFIDDDTIIINDFRQENGWFYKAFEIAIHNTGLDYIKIPYNVYNNKSHNQANGEYINYLRIADTIIIPTFGFKEDDFAVKELEKVFTKQKIFTINSNDVANDGGILNCITWNIQTGKTC